MLQLCNVQKGWNVFKRNYMLQIFKVLSPCSKNKETGALYFPVS